MVKDKYNLDPVYYGFDISWIYEIYHEVKNDESKLKEIEDKYQQYYLNYLFFIDSLDFINDNQKKNYYKKEKKCKFCNEYYPYNRDFFLEIRDRNSEEKITEDLCYNCLRSLEKCSKCERKIEEPYEIIYTQNQKSICKKCK